VADTRRLLSDWLEAKNHGGDHGLNEHAHSDGDHHRDHGDDHRQYDTLGFNATGPTHGDHRRDREWGRCLNYLTCTGGNMA